MVIKVMRYLADNALAVVALFVALGGVSYAATGGFTGSDGSLQGCVGGHGQLTVIKPGKHCKKGQTAIRWSVIGPAGARGAAGPAGPRGSTGPEGAPNPHALTAENALALGGLPASDFTRSDCASTTGQIKGFAEVPADPGPAAQIENVSLAYSCSGEAVEVVKGLGEGEYQVTFKGNPADIALATVNTESSVSAPYTAAVHIVEPGKFNVFTSEDNALKNERFELLLP
jgi:hypothetical protein